MRTLLVGCVLLAAIIAAPPARATQVLQLSVEELSAASAKVVRGKVATSRSYWNSDHTKIYTEVVLDAEETYKGERAGSVRIVQLGGTVDGVRVTVHGALGWTPGEEVLVFLEAYRDDGFVVAGLSQGKFNIVRDPQTNEAFVTRVPFHDLELIGTTGAKVAPAQFEKVPLAQFIDRALGDSPELHQE